MPKHENSDIGVTVLDSNRAQKVPSFTLRLHDEPTRGCSKPFLVKIQRPMSPARGDLLFYNQDKSVEFTYSPEIFAMLFDDNTSIHSMRVYVEAWWDNDKVLHFRRHRVGASKEPTW